jgi:hypothetical protein
MAGLDWKDFAALCLFFGGAIASCLFFLIFLVRLIILLPDAASPLRDLWPSADQRPRDPDP